MKIRNFFDTHKYLTYTVLITLVTVVACVGISIKVISAGVRDWWIFAVLGFGTLTVPVIAFLIRKKTLSLQVLAVLIIGVLGILYTFVFTPNSVPDEPLHYTTAYHISNKMLFKNGDEQHKMIMRVEDDAFLKNTSVVLSKTEYANVTKNGHVACREKTEIVADQGYIENKTLPYLASAIGITIGRITNLSAFWTYQLGRIFNLFSFLVFIFFAVKLMPFNKVAIIAMATLPMNMHIVASVSYDVYSIGGVLLIFAYFMHLKFGEKPIAIKQLGILAVLVAFVIPQKVVYIGVCALILLLPKERFKKPNLHLLFKFALLFVAFASILLVQMQKASNLASGDQAVAGYSLQYILNNPAQVFKMMFNTFCYEMDLYIKSITGYFGWFQIESPWFLSIPFILALLLSFMRKENEPKSEGILTKLYSVALFVLIFVLTALTMLLDHTTFGSNVIEGVQGRYFIPAIPLLFVALRNDMILVSNKVDDVSLLLVHTINVLNVIFCVFAVVVLV